MSKSLRGTKTLENLMKSFAGESQATMRYRYFASVAGKEGYKQIQNIFLETAENEKEHAKVFMNFALKYLDGENPAPVEINATYPFAYGDTIANLNSAADGEKDEADTDYPEFARIAKEEGFNDIAARYLLIADVERHHETRYRKLLANIENETVFKKEEKVAWKCINCGLIHEGEAAPKLCPACLHKQEYFQIQDDCY